MKVKDFSDLIILAMLWGASFLFMRVSVPDFGAIPLMLVRVTLATLFLLPIILWKKRQHEIINNLKPIAFVGIVGSAIPFTLIAYSTLYVTSGFASVVNAATPIFSALVAYIWLGQRLTRLAVIGLVIGIIGVVLLVWDKIGFQEANLFLAVIAGISATIFYGISANYTKKYLSNVKPLVLAAGSQISASLVLLPLSLFFLPEVMPNTEAINAVIVLGIVCTGFAYIIFFRLISALGPTKAISVTYLIPVFGLFWGAIFLQEKITSTMLFGCLLILLGVALTTGLLNFKRKARVIPS